MKNTIRIALLLLVCMMPACMSAGNGQGEPAKKYPEIKFERTTIDLGTFSQDETLHTCVFKFTNVGKAKLVINYVSTSCGCTVAEYPKDYISPGASGEIKVTYDSKGKEPGPFKKAIQVYTNCKDDLARLIISGYMTALPKEDVKRK